MFLLLLFLSFLQIATPCTNPNIAYSTLIGDALQESMGEIALSADSRLGIGATTYSFNFPARAPQHGVDAVSLQLNASGSAIERVVWVNPPNLNIEDYTFATGFDGVGNQYVTGETGSADFCAALGSPQGYDTSYNSNRDGFIYQVRPDGTIGYCTYLGGSDGETIHDMAVLEDGEVIVVGGTWSADFPTTTTTPHHGLRDLFVTRLSADGQQLRHSHLIGGKGQEDSWGVAVDAEGAVYVAGWTNSADFPTLNAHQANYHGRFDAFLLKLNETELRWATYLGGAGEDRGYDVAIDGQGRPILIGTTTSADLPATPNAYDTTLNSTGANDGLIARFSADGQTLSYLTYLGGSGEDRLSKLAIGWGTQLFITGYTQSADFPTTPNALQSTLNGAEDAFILQLSDGNLISSTFWGGSQEDRGVAVAIDPSGAVYLAGNTRSADFCTTPQAYDTSHNGDDDLFVSKLSIGRRNPHTVWLPLINHANINIHNHQLVKQHQITYHLQK